MKKNNGETPKQESKKKTKKWKILILIILLLGLMFTVIFCDVYKLGNENVLFLFVDEEKGDPGIVEVSSIITFSNLRSKGNSIDIDPLSTNTTLNYLGININNSLIKAPDIKQGIEYAKEISKDQSKIDIHRVVVIDSETLKELVDVVGDVPVDFNQQILILGLKRDIIAKGDVNGIMAKQILQGKAFPIVDPTSIRDIPEASLWRVKSKIIGEISISLLDQAKYNKTTRKDIYYKILRLYREDKIKVYNKNMTLILMDSLPEGFGRIIMDFVVNIIR